MHLALTSHLQHPREAERLVTPCRFPLEMPQDEPRGDPRQPCAMPGRPEGEEVTWKVAVWAEEGQTVHGFVVDPVPGRLGLQPRDRRIQQGELVHQLPGPLCNRARPQPG